MHGPIPRVDGGPFSGPSARLDGSRLPWNADYATSRSNVPEKQWCTVGFTYDSRFIRAYIDGVMEPRSLDP